MAVIAAGPVVVEVEVVEARSSGRISRSIKSRMPMGEYLITRSDGKANPMVNRLNTMDSGCSHKSRNSFHPTILSNILFYSFFFSLILSSLNIAPQPLRRLIFWSLVEVSLHYV